jgi:predicted O-linked N-acetylglucosamine transferase (SPINDLY family)
MRSAIRRDVEFLPLARRFAQIQEEIRRAAFDVLYYWEIGTDATNYFLPFLRLAPVQCTAWGYQTTSGIATVDYYLSSALIEPADAHTHYSEQLLRASTLLTYQERVQDVEPADVRAQFGIPRDRHLYLCPHQLGKFHPDFDELLAEVLRRDPQGEVVILEDRHAVASAQLAARFGRTMPDVRDRVRLLPRQSRPSYLQLLAEADVVLDPPHFSGANTTYDALALGKAVVARPTEFRRGRFTLACCRKIGLEEMIVPDQQAYVDLAVELGSEPDQRRQLEARIREASCDLFEDPIAVAEFTRIISQLVQIARQGTVQE